jgi:hypothetical protein
MQLLTGEITDQTRHNLEVGTVFRTITNSYSVRRWLVLVDALWRDGSSVYYEISRLEIGATYGVRIEQLALESNDSFFDIIQHVEYEEADAEFRRQTNAARKRALEAQVALMEAESVRDSFWAMGDRLGG